MTTKQIGIWSGSIYRNSTEAQKAFSVWSKSHQTSPKALDYHHAVATQADRDRVASVAGEIGKVASWYWEDALNAD